MVIYTNLLDMLYLALCLVYLFFSPTWLVSYTLSYSYTLTHLNTLNDNVMDHESNKSIVSELKPNTVQDL